MAINMIKKMKIKLSVDIQMTILLFALMSYQYTRGTNHEIAGALMLILFILHHVLNINWYKNLTKGKYKVARLLQTVIDFALLAVTLIQMISGIAMSRSVFTFVDFGLRASDARSLHMIFAYAGFLLMGFHIGLHYSMIINMFRKVIGLKSKQLVRTIILKCVAVVIAGYGIYALNKRNFISYILQKNQFAFYDYEEPVIFFLIDYLAIMGLTIFIAYYLQKGIMKLEHRKRQRKGI